MASDRLTIAAARPGMELPSNLSEIIEKERRGWRDANAPDCSRPLPCGATRPAARDVARG